MNCLCNWQERCKNDPPSLTTLRRGFTLLTQYAFSDPTRYGVYEKELACRVFNTDDKLSKINITASSAVDPTNTNNIPGILVSIKDGIQYTNPYFTRQTVASADYSAATDTTIAKTQIEFICRDYDADICSILGDIVTLFFTGARPKILDTWFWMLDMKVVSQTEPKMKNQEEGSSSSSWYESVVVISIDYEYNVNIASESKRLKDFSIISHN